MRSLYFALLRQKDHVIFIFAFTVSVLILFSDESPAIYMLREQVNSTLSFTRLPKIWFESKRSLNNENAELRNSNMQLKMLLDEVLHLEYENQDLRNLLDFHRKTRLNLLPATIQGRGITTSFSSFSIDVGSNDGVAINDPVVIAEGVVGKAIVVGEETSVVQLLSDPDFRLGVIIEPSGAVGIMSWLGNNKCEIREINKNAHVQIGDQVYTSRFSDIYPPNIPVGEVVAIYDERGSFQKRLTMETNFSISTLEYVFVVIDQADENP